MSAENTLAILKSLADPTRLDIVRMLASKQNDSASCTDISACSKLSQPAMSHHFGKLVDAGVLLEKKVGTKKIYELNNPLLGSIGIDPHKL